MRAKRKREIFVGSTSRGLKFVKALAKLAADESQKMAADESLELKPWKGLFTPSTYTLSNLLQLLPRFDGAVFVVLDKDSGRRDSGHTPSENVYLEIGMAMAILGRRNVVLVLSNKATKPTDLAGLHVINIPENPGSAHCRDTVRDILAYFRNIPPALRPGRGKLSDFTTNADGFYEKLQGYLRYSSDSVFVVGSGFHCNSDKARRQAEKYLRVLTGCAHRHPLIRVETAPKELTEWISYVATYLAPLHNVKIYIPKEPTTFVYQNICLIDPNTEDAVIELMLSTEKDEAGEIVERAGVGAFLQSAHAAQVVHERLQRLIGSHLKLVDADQLLAAYNIPARAKARSHKKVRFFTYGSNMCEAYIKDRLKSVKFVGTGRLPGHRLVFATAGTVFKEAVGTIERDDNSDVWGGIAEVTETDFKRMDFYEGVGMNFHGRDGGTVKRREMDVVLKNGSVERLPLYVSDQNIKDGRPSSEYLERLRTGAEDLKLLPHYQLLLHEIQASDE